MGKLRHRITRLIIKRNPWNRPITVTEKNQIIDYAKVCDRLQILEVEVRLHFLDDDKFLEMINETTRLCKGLTHFGANFYAIGNASFEITGNKKNKIKNFFEVCSSIN